MSALDAAVSSEAPSERPRLQLAPRSAAAASSGPAKSSIFGGARTREEILAAKGVDVKKKEAELDAKARPKRLTKQQAEELAAAEAEIKFEQDKLKNATTPGEKAVAQSKVKEKTKEVEALAEKFKAQNLAYERKKNAERAAEKEGGAEAKPRPQFIRPSERRRMREEAAANGQPMDNDRDAAFSSFNQRGSGGSRGGYRQDDAAYGSFTNNSGGGRRRNNSRDGYDQSGVDFSAFGGGRSRRQAGAGCKLYVGNISFQMTQADLQALFSPFGRVQDTYLPVERDSGRPRGFGFVTFSSSNEAQAAIQALDGTDHDGRQLRVNVSEPRQN